MKNIAIHTCCAPCLTAVQKWLKTDGFENTAYFYNPNIYPEGEYVKRYFVLKDYANIERLKLVFEFDNQKTDPGDCPNCYKARLLKTAQYAKNNSLECFTTTLLISPYQNHELLKETGEKISEEAGVKFFYRDFRELYNESRKTSIELGLYRQKYCGCQKSRGGNKIVQTQKVAA